VTFPRIDPRRWLSPLARLAAWWKAFWFTPADPTVLGLIRIATGVIMLYIFVASTPLLVPFFGPDGWVDMATEDILRHETPMTLPASNWDDDAPPAVIRPEMSRAPEAEAIRQRWGIDPAMTYDLGTPLFSPWFHITDPVWMRIVHGLAIAVSVLFILGLGTRVVAVLAWVLMLGYIHRATAALFGMDTMIAILLLYLMLTPAGSALSLDRLIQRWRTSVNALSHGVREPLPGPTPSVGANIGLRLLQVHFCMIYLASGMSKLQGPAWWNGTALWQTLSNYEFAPARFELFTVLLRALTANRWVWEGTLFFGGSVFTLVLELGLPFLIWYPRWRGLCIIGAIMLHTGIAVTMGLTAFSFLMMTIVMAFLPAATVNALLARLFRGPAHLWQLYSSKPAVGLTAANAVHALDAFGQVTPVDVSHGHRGEDEPAWLPVPAHLSGAMVVGESGAAHSGYPMVERLVRSLRILWPLALLTWLPGVGRIGRAIAPGEEPGERLEREPASVGGR
jgi:uncharacterized membrane protein YphA (DoxX/SURF4 family)